jgi:hypothetical protein
VAFDHDGRLWISNRGADGVTIVEDLDGARTTRAVTGAPGSTHFMRRPSSLAFGAPGRFATVHDTDERTQSFTDSDFMGPTLWTADLPEFEGGHASHYDMLHNSPNAQGVEWQDGNVYWVADGWHGSLTRYDFGADHGPGGEDHSDGIIERFAEGELGYLEDVPSHLALDRTTGMLYAADPANGRVLALNTRSGARVGELDDNFDLAEAYLVSGASVFWMANELLEMPSGIALAGDILYVSDRAQSRIVALRTSDSSVVDWLDLGPWLTAQGISDPQLAGVEVDAAGRLYVVSIGGQRVIRITPPAAP